MPTERAGYTVTMFLVDVSRSMGKMRSVDFQNSKGQSLSKEISNLDWALQFVKLKIQEMIFNGRKTDQCGVITFGSDDTKNIVNSNNGGYENVWEYVPIGQPNSSTIAKIDSLRPSSTSGDPIDALIVGIETQARYLAKKATWTRKIVLITDGESPIEIEDWEATIKKLDALNIGLTIIGVDFDDHEYPYEEPDKSNIKRINEQFYHQLISSTANGIIGTCALALRETAMPDIKQVRSALMTNVLRLGDVDTRGEEAIELYVKTSKCTSLSRPKGWKKFSFRENPTDDMDTGGDDEVEAVRAIYGQLRMRTEYYIDRNTEENANVKEEEDENLLGTIDGEPEEPNVEHLERIDKEELVRGFKYGTTYVPCPAGDFPKLKTKKGIDICGFFPAKNFRREQSMGEIQYIWADPSSPQQQAALSSIVKAMHTKNCMAIGRWVSRDDMNPKMGVLTPVLFENIDCLVWSHMPFADDLRKYTFASLTNLVNKKGEVLNEHPYLPTETQVEAMGRFVDAMDLMDAGERDEDGIRQPWFNTLESYNPAIHRVKQAMFHCAIINDVATNPLPPPHPELVKFFHPPKAAVKRAKEPLERCKSLFQVKEVPKRVGKARKDGQVHAQDEDESILLLDQKATVSRSPVRVGSKLNLSPNSVKVGKVKPLGKNAADSDTEDEEELPELSGTSAPPENEYPTLIPGRAPGRIIGNTNPLADFQKNIAQGDVVTKAVQDLTDVILEVVLKPFAARRQGEMIECMKALRLTCLEEDEIDAWNSFLKNLKKGCEGKGGNPTFWKEVSGLVGLITNQEAKKQGGESNITEKEASEFISS